MEVKLAGPFMINSRQFSKKELLAYGKEQIVSDTSDDWLKNIYRFILDFFDENVLLKQKTSGTTGAPKIISLDRKAMIRSARNTLDHFSLEPGQSALLCLPVQYIAGKMMLVRALLGSLNLIIVEPSGDPLKHIDVPVDFAAMVPLQVHASLDAGDRIDLIGKLLLGGGETDHTIQAKIRQLRSTEVYETFGMSETYTHFAVRRLNGLQPEDSFRVFEGIEFGIDKRQCLYVNIPGITEERVQSNDLVKLTGEDTFQWQGRIDNVINSGGVKIIPELLEKQMKALIGHELFLLGAPDEKLGQKLVLAVECEHGCRTEPWMTRIKRSLEKYEVPKEIVIIPHIPRTRSMKIDRNAAKKLI